MIVMLDAFTGVTGANPVVVEGVTVVVQGVTEVNVTEVNPVVVDGVTEVAEIGKNN